MMRQSFIVAAGWEAGDVWSWGPSLVSDDLLFPESFLCPVQILADAHLLPSGGADPAEKIRNNRVKTGEYIRHVSLK